MADKWMPLSDLFGVEGPEYLPPKSISVMTVEDGVVNLVTDGHRVVIKKVKPHEWSFSYEERDPCGRICGQATELTLNDSQVQRFVNRYK